MVIKAEAKVPPEPQGSIGRRCMISVSVALIQTTGSPAEAASLRTRDQCVTWSACLVPSLRRYQFILLGEQRHMCVNNLPKIVTWSGAAGTRTCDLSVTSPTP